MSRMMYSHSFNAFCKLFILSTTLATSARTGSALTVYTNSSRLVQSVSTLSPLKQSVELADLILHGLGGAASTSSNGHSSSQTPSPTSAETQHFSDAAAFAANVTHVRYSIASTTSKVTMSGDVFTIPANPRDSAEAVSKAQRCWSEILTWSSSSYSWYQASVANREWPLLTSATIDEGRTHWTSTYYPKSPSVYTLCDGSPRVNERPWTTTSTFNTTYSTHTWTTLATPTFRPQPCTPSGQDCHIWYNGSSIAVVNEDSILKLCGNPPHGIDGQCVFGIEGAVELIYFPVNTGNGSLCTDNASTISQGPTATTGPDVITYSGRTFTSGSAYISIKSLSAYYDGFGYTVGPNFSDFIMTLKSEDVSTQCRGVKTSTMMNFADLNWPVPVSAYECQMPCGYNQQGQSTPTECSTIWSDFNPLLAIPSQITDLSPLWKTCKLDVPSLGNYWIDPPIALQEQHSVAAPTLPSSPTVVTTPAAPSPTQASPATSTTSTGSVQVLTILSTTRTIETSSRLPFPTSSAVATFAEDPGSIDTSKPEQSMISSTTEGAADPLSSEISPVETPASTLDDQEQTPSSLKPEIATAAGFSILTQALSSFHDAESATVTSTITPPTSIKASGVVVSLASGKVTAIQTNDNFILDSSTLSVGEVVTVSGNELSFNSGGLVVGESTFAASALSTPTATRTAFVIAPGSFTLAASPVKGHSEVVQIGTATLSIGGPAATVSGQVLSKASSGIVLLPHETGSSQGGAIPSVVEEKPAQTAVLAAGSHTVTAVIYTGNYSAISVGGTTLSLGGDAAIIQDATFTVGPGGLGVVRSHTSRVDMNSTTTIPSVLITSIPSSTRSRWSSSATVIPTSTSGGGREEQSWAGLLLMSSSLILLLCI